VPAGTTWLSPFLKLVVMMMFRQCLAIMRREIFYMWRDKGLRNILLLGPVVGLLLFSAIYSAGVLKNIPTVIVDLDHSRTSRELIKNLNQAEYLQVTGYPQSYQEAQGLVARGQAVVGVVIPQDFGRDVLLNRPTRIYTMIDGSNMIYATNASSAVLTVTKTISAQAGVKALIARGVDPSQAAHAYQTIELKEEGWFNPTFNYAYFLVLGLIMNIWQQCCTMAACMNIIGETRAKSWLQLKAAGISKTRLFVSKSVVHISVFMAIALLLYLISYYILKLPLQCSFGSLMLFTLAFVVALHSVGTLASSLALNAVDATRFGMIIALTSFVLSGFTWPLEAMPGFLSHLVWILPQTWFFQGLNYLSFKTPGPGFISSYGMHMLLIAFICYAAAAVATAWRER
jgi:ABC-2 type transport system permease protein